MKVKHEADFLKPSMWVKHRNGIPVEYRYGDENAGTMLSIEGGFATEEEAFAAWEMENKTRIPRDQWEDAARYE